MTDDDVVIDLDHGGDDDNNGSSSSSGGGGGKRRTAVHIKKDYGTETIKPQSKCEVCGSYAIGVVRFRDRPNGRIKTKVVCRDDAGRHKDLENFDRAFDVELFEFSEE